MVEYSRSSKQLQIAICRSGLKVDARVDQQASSSRLGIAEGKELRVGTEAMEAHNIDTEQKCLKFKGKFIGDFQTTDLLKDWVGGRPEGKYGLMKVECGCSSGGRLDGGKLQKFVNDLMIRSTEEHGPNAIKQGKNVYESMVFVGHPCTCVIKFGGESKQNLKIKAEVWFAICFLYCEWVFVTPVPLLTLHVKIVCMCLRVDNSLSLHIKV